MFISAGYVESTRLRAASCKSQQEKITQQENTFLGINDLSLQYGLFSRKKKQIVLSPLSGGSGPPNEVKMRSWWW